MAQLKKKAAPAAAEPAQKTASVKTGLRKAAAKKVEEVYLQAGGTEWNISDCKERVTAAYTALGHRASGIKKLVVYLKPEEGKAYYVINDTENGSVDL